MPHPLEWQLAQLRRRARQYLLVSAVARALALVLVAGGSLALVDAWFHFQDRGLRAIFSLLWLTTVTVGLRWIAAAVRDSRFSQVQIAQRLEEFFPQLRGRLASAVEFLAATDNDPVAGSSSLRRAVIHDAECRISQISLSRALDVRPLRRSLAVLGGVLACATLIASLHGEQARIAAARLCNPLSDLAWPRNNQLALVSPVFRLAQGETFEMQVVDTAGAPLPEIVEMQYRFRSPDGEVIDESEPLQIVGDQLLARREGVQRSFEYRAVGGDDYTMPWTNLEVVEPPSLRNISVTLHFPTYTGWPPRAVEPSFRALMATRVELQATTTKPLSSAQVQIAETGVPATISPDGYQLSIARTDEPGFVVSATGPYALDLVDRDGFHNGDAPKYEVRAVADAAPSVEIERPKANLYLTADALLPLEVRARDDLIVREITLSYVRSDHSDEGHHEEILVPGPVTVPEDLAAASAVDGFTGDRREVLHPWNLKTLGLSPGTQLTFHAAAKDYAGQVGQSLPRQVTIVTADEAQDRLADRQGLIFNELSRILQMQESARSHVAGLQVQLEQTGEIKQADIDALQGAGLNQQQVERALTSDQEGLRRQISDLLDELKMNRIDGPDTQQQMEGIFRAVEQLAAGALPDAARALTTATKSAQVGSQEMDSTSPQRDKVASSLESAAAAQDRVAETLSQMIDSMKQWVNFRHFHQEIGEVARQQEQIAQETADLGRKTLSRDVADLDPQQRADLQKLAQRQAELARRLNRVEQRLDDAASAAQQEDPLTADSMADALAHTRGNRVAEGMRQAAQNVEQNRLGQAGAAQNKAVGELQELLDILSNRRENELSRRVKKLRDAEGNLARLREQQQGLRKKIKEAERLPAEEQRRELERLSREQRELQTESERFGRSLQRLQAEQASAGLAQAGAQMGQAAESGTDGDAQGAASRAADAERDLAKAQEELERQRRQAESDLAQEQLGRIDDAIASIHDRQQKLIGETMHYQLRQAERGHLTRAEAASVRDLAAQQGNLRDESQGLTTSLAGAAVFQFGLELIAQDMTRATDRLEQREVGDETVRAENLALQRLDQLRTALQDDNQQPADQAQEEQQQGDDEAGAQQGAQQKNHSVAELKLLKSIQEQINERTQALVDASRASTRWSIEQQVEFDALRRDQGRLADLVTNMSEVADERPEGTPDRLPDIRQPDGPENAGEPRP